jgi:hypothetical protein
MAKKRRSRRRRAANRHRRARRNYRRRSNPIFAMAAPRKRRRRYHRSSGRRRGRRRNPSEIGQLTSGGMLETIAGAAAGFFGANAIPSLVPQLANYNTGVSGYVLNAASGLGVAWLLGKFWNRKAGTGALIGTGLSVLLRIVKDNAASSGNVTAAAMSGDLAYYTDDRFPYPQGAGGPYAGFPGNPSLANPPFPATSAAAVRAGAAAAQAALPAAAAAAPSLHGIGTGRWGLDSAGNSSRWN